MFNRFAEFFNRCTEFARSNAPRVRLAWYAMAAVLAVFTYFYGLDSQQIPKNSDEYLYVHIARMTAASGHLLPLQSEFATMRNIKPPLMFWHAIAATDWGQKWDLWHLRYPSVIYTLLTAMLVFLLARKLTGKVETGLIALLTYLAFFSTYRFGRPYLTDPGTVFWLFLPFFTLLYWRPAAFDSRLWFPVLLGLETGLGLLYKSFFFVLPVGLGLMWWYLHHRQYRWREFFVRDSWKPVLIGVLSLALFGMWLVLDPDPGALWREFFWGENMSKVGQANYLGKMFLGDTNILDESIWSLALGYAQNAALLALPVLGLFWVAFRQRKQATDSRKNAVDLGGCAVSHVQPGEPAFRPLPAGGHACAGDPVRAVLGAHQPQAVYRRADDVRGGACRVPVHVAAPERRDGRPPLRTRRFWAVMGFTATLLLLTRFVPTLARVMVNVVVLLVFLCFALFVAPFDGVPGNYSAEAQQYAQGKDVWVPCNKFIGKDEGHRFLLPGANVYGYYDHLPGRDAEGLAKSHRLFAVRLPMQDKPCADCRVIGERIEITGRQYGPEIKAMLLKGEVFQHLFVREWLVESTVPSAQPGWGQTGERVPVA